MNVIRSRGEKEIAIRVENLSKRYHIGELHQRHDTLRDALVDSLTRMTRIGRKNNSGHSQNLRQKEETIWALKDVSFEVKRGEVVGIIGRNGAGKSTLLKILSRITEPTRGYVEMHGRVGSLLEVGTGFHPELTGRENIYLSGAMLGMRKEEIDRRFDEIVDFSGVEKFIDTPVKRYSSGMYVRLGFAVAAHLDPEILLVDEVLAVGDAAFQKKCLGKMGDVAKEGRTVLFVSHNMGAISNLCSKAIVIDHGRVVRNADVSSAITHYLQIVTTRVVKEGLNTAVRSGKGPIRFKSFHLEDGRGGVVQDVISGQTVRFVIGYHSASSLSGKERIEVSIGIRSSEGFLITSLSTYYFDWRPFERVPVEGKFECIIPKLPLRSGIYWLDLYCAVEGQVSDRLRYAVKLYVTDGDYFGTGRVTRHETGSIFVDHIWDIRFGSYDKK